MSALLGPAAGAQLREGMGRMRETVERAARNCPTELAMEVVGGKWKLVILEHLATGTRRFGELQRSLPEITPRMLTRQLRELENDGLVARTVYAQVPPKVEYQLSGLGRTLEPALMMLRRWGEHYREHVGQMSSRAS